MDAKKVTKVCKDAGLEVEIQGRVHVSSEKVIKTQERIHANFVGIRMLAVTILRQICAIFIG